MKRIAFLAAFFWMGALLAGLTLVVLDVYWVGHPSPHSDSALFEIQMVFSGVTATAGTILYFASLVFQRSKIDPQKSGDALLAVASGATYNTFLGLSGQRLFMLDGGTTSLGWIFLLLLPVALSFLIQLRLLQR